MDPNQPEIKESVGRNIYVSLVQEGDQPEVLDSQGSTVKKYPEVKIGNIGMAHLETFTLGIFAEDKSVDKRISKLVTKDGIKFLPYGDIKNNPEMVVKATNPLIRIRDVDCYVYASLDGQADLLKSKMQITQEEFAKLLDRLSIPSEDTLSSKETGFEADSWELVGDKNIPQETNAAVFLDTDPALLSEMKFRFEIIQKPGGDLQS